MISTIKRKLFLPLSPQPFSRHPQEANFENVAGQQISVATCRKVMDAKFLPESSALCFEVNATYAFHGNF